MGIQVRKSSDRGFFDHGWLKTYHTFSFGEFYDPDSMGYRHLRVLNEDRIGPNQGFPSHSHEDMEIISIVMNGSLEHSDSLGHTSRVHVGECQIMSSGSGVVHSECNPGKNEETHFFQVWITPREKGLTPHYQHRQIPYNLKLNRWCLIVSPDGRENSSIIRQDVFLYISKLEQNRRLTRSLFPDRYGFLHVMNGSIVVNGVILKAGDAAQLTYFSALEIISEVTSDVLFFDLN